jgi:hypothetical protein
MLPLVCEVSLGGVRQDGGGWPNVLGCIGWIGENNSSNLDGPCVDISNEQIDGVLLYEYEYAI